MKSMSSVLPSKISLRNSSQRGHRAFGSNSTLVDFVILSSGDPDLRFPVFRTSTPLGAPIRYGSASQPSPESDIGVSAFAIEIMASSRALDSEAKATLQAAFPDCSSR